MNDDLNLLITFVEVYPNNTTAQFIVGLCIKGGLNKDIGESYRYWNNPNDRKVINHYLPPEYKDMPILKIEIIDEIIKATKPRGK